MITRKGFLSRLRDFIKITVFSITVPSIFNRVLFAENSVKGTADIVALKGGSRPEELFYRGIKEVGGMGRFVSKGKTVLVKPNIGWDRSPSSGANTNPDIVEAVIRECYKAGASKVYVFDHTCDSWQGCYKNSGIEAAVKRAGGEMVPADANNYYIRTDIPRGKVLKQAQVHKLFLQCDTVISVPVLKHHSSTILTASMKNLMGVVLDRGEWHRTDLHQCIADFSTLRKPDLVIIDGWRVMTKNGPRGYSASDVEEYRYMFFSTDPVAADSASAMVLAQTNSRVKTPADIRYIRIAGEMGIGKNDLSKINIRRITL